MKRNLTRLFSTTRSPQSYIETLDKHWSKATPRAPKGNNIVVDFAKGVWIQDVEGRRYIDFQSGIGVTSTGHCHPRVVAAIQEQAGKGIHLQQNCVISRPTVDLINKLREVTPAPLDRFFFNCTGSEAVESAIKLARHETGKQNVIYMKKSEFQQQAGRGEADTGNPEDVPPLLPLQGSFHGRSLATLAMTSSKVVYRQNFGPLPGGFFQAPFPYCLRCKCGQTNEQCCNYAIDSIQEMFKEVTHPSETAAIILEPILGEGGYVVPPPGYFKQLRKLCDDNGIFLIADEVQSGVGRTGKMWAVQHEDIVPDILVFAKGIASGMVLSGIATPSKLMQKSTPGSMGSTYGANAVSAAAAIATLDVIRDDGLLDNASKRGAQLQSGLKALQRKYPHLIDDVRGRGCMVGLEFSPAAGPGFAGAVTANCMDEGLLLLTTGWRETIRFIPPLVVSESEMATALGMFERGLVKAVINDPTAP